MNEKRNEWVTSVVLGDLWSWATCPHKSLKAPYSDDQVLLIYKSKRGDLCCCLTDSDLWQLKIRFDFKKQMCLLDMRWRTWRCLTSMLDSKQLGKRCFWLMRMERTEMPNAIPSFMCPSILLLLIYLPMYSYFIHWFIPVFSHSPNSH